MARKNHFNYFDYFVRSGKRIIFAVDYLCEVLNSYDCAKISEYTSAMHKLENEADMEKHEMTEKLLHEFITPIEREDIMALAQQVDNVMDALDEVLLRLYMYSVKAMNPAAVNFSKLVQRCCHELAETLTHLEDFKKPTKLREHIVSVNSLESEGDIVYIKAVHDLFENPTDPLYSLIWMRIMNSLEICLDSCEHVTDIIEGVIMKNS